MKLKISTHSGDEDTVEVDKYESEDLAEQINDEDVQAIALGKNVYSRIDIKNIRPVEENAE